MQIQFESQQQMADVVDAMTRFASTTRDDRLSVAVARVAQRLQHAGKAFERPLTRQEISVIRPFLNHVAAGQVHAELVA